METKGLSPHRSVVATKQAEKKKAECQANIDSQTKGMPPHKAAAIRKNAEKERFAAQGIDSAPLPALPTAMVRVTTKAVKTKPLKVFSEELTPRPTIFSNAAWEKVEDPRTFLVIMPTPPCSVIVSSEPEEEHKAEDEAVEQIPTVNAYHDEDTSNYEDTSHNAATYHDDSSTELNIKDHICYLHPIFSPDQNSQMTAVTIYRKPAPISEADMLALTDMAEMELDIEMAKMKLFPEGVLDVVLPDVNVAKAMPAKKKVNGAAEHKASEEYEAEMINERDAYQVAYGRWVKRT